jgi:HSP20 family protein
MDLVERDGNLVLRADLPGMDRDDIDIEVKDRVLTVSGERKYEHEDKREGFYRVERSFGRFSRALRLPRGVDASAVSASFDRGVLEVTVPKPTEPAATKIAIGVGPAAQVETTEASEVEAPQAEVQTDEAQGETHAEPAGAAA